MQLLSDCHFLLFGVGNYRAGKNFFLTAPVRDVCRFIEFLIENGVRGDRICAYVAPIPDQRKNIANELARLGQLTADGEFLQQHSGAIDHKRVVEALEHAQRDDVRRLMIFWSGHGYAQIGGESADRDLMFSNYSSKNRLTLDFASLLRHLLTIPGYPREQILLIDACGDFYNELEQGVSLASLPFSRGNGNAASISQFSMFATHASGTARSRHDSEFTSEVLRALSRSPSTDSWHDVFAAVLENMKQSDRISTADLPDWVIVTAPPSEDHYWIRGVHFSGGGGQGTNDSTSCIDIDQLPQPLAPLWVTSPARTALMEEMDRDLTRTIVFLYGGAGLGKSTFVRKWVETRISNGAPNLSSVFAWSFSSNDADQGTLFARSALAHLTHVTGRTVGIPTDVSPGQLGKLVAEQFMRLGGILILDALESLQDDSVDGGEVYDECVKGFLQRYLTLRGRLHPGHALLVVTSRWKAPSLCVEGNDERSLCRELPPLEQTTSLGFLSKIELRGKSLQNIRSETLNRIAERCGGHPLTLLLAASFIVARQEYGQDEELELFPSGVDDKAHLHAANVMDQYDAMFRHTDNDIFRTAREVLLLLSELSVTIDKHIVAAAWNSAFGTAKRRGDTIAVDFAIDYLSEMGLLKLTNSEVSSHELVGAYFRKMANEKRPVSRREICASLFQALTREEQRPSLSEGSTELKLDSLRLGIRAGLADDAYRLIFEPYLRKLPGHSESIDYDVGESALSYFFVDGWDSISDDLSAAAKVRVLMDADILLSVRYGYSSKEAVAVQSQLAAVADEPSSQPDLIKFQHRRVQTALGQWRGAFFSGQCDAAARLAESFHQSDDRASDRLGLALSLVGVRMLTASLFFIGEHRRAAELAQRVFESEKTEFQWSEFGDTMDPAVSCLGFGAMCSWIIGEPDAAEEYHRESLRRSMTGSAYTRCVALHLAQSYAYLGGYPESTLEFALQLENIAVEEVFAAWSAAAAIFQGWAISLGGNAYVETQQPGRLIESGIRRWRSTKARITLGYWYLIAAEVAFKKGALAEVASYVEASRGELAYTHERWYEPLLYRQVALLEHARGGEKQVIEEAVRAARASAIASEAAAFLHKIDGDLQQLGMNAND
jgi:hypothetical protein